MLKRLKYSVTFASTGRTLENDIAFEPGLTAIGGPNESGKSTVLEMIRFALFGTAALRGSIEDFAKYSVSLEFQIRGADWRVERAPGKAFLYQDDTIVVTGVTPTNNRIVELFGYGLNVFDIANNCNQGDVEALTRMKPADRKKMVDQVIGFAIIDKVTDYVTENAAEIRGEFKAIHPVEPVKPEGDFESSEIIRTKIEELQPLARELSEIRGWLSSTRQAPAMPQAVAECSKTEVDEYDRQRALHAQLAGLPLVVLPVEQLDAMEKAWADYVEYHEFKQQHGDRPEQSQAEVERLRNLVQAQKRWNERVKLEKAIAGHRAKGVQCPDCGSSFPLEHAHVRELEKQLEGYSDAADGEKTEFTEDQLNRLSVRAGAWAGRRATVPAKPVLTPRDIDLQRQALALAHIRAELKPLSADPTPRYRAWLSYVDQKARYDADLVVFAAYSAEKEARILRMRAIEIVEPQLRDLNRQMTQAIEFEGRVAAYDEAVVRFEHDTIRKEAAAERLTQYENAGKGLKLLRSRIKMHLVPSLNAVASHLISEMTGGQRTSIIIDESFTTILVDGQDIATLSGSGKVVANLAIRIGLGQVLTNKVFSVFMGDEIDASMDQDRAGYTAECLNALTGGIKQIVLVSHKQLSAQRHIMIGANNAGTRPGLDRPPVLHRGAEAG